MATAAFLKMMPEPEDQMIDRLLTNICRCGTYNRIRQAIHAAAGETTALFYDAAADGEQIA